MIRIAQQIGTLILIKLMDYKFLLSLDYLLNQKKIKILD